MDLQQVEARLVNLTAEHRGVTSSLDDMSRRRNEALRQVEEQQDKLGRAQRQVAKLQGRMGEDSPQVKEADLAEVGIGEYLYGGHNLLTVCCSCSDI
jgi:peptidoglycan hydrolase CwlO-like protein